MIRYILGALTGAIIGGLIGYLGNAVVAVESSHPAHGQGLLSVQYWVSLDCGEISFRRFKVSIFF
jgi:hypothetical protein